MFSFCIRNNFTSDDQKYGESTIEPTNEILQELQDEVREEMEILNKKIAQLLPKVKKDRNVQKLRDPIDQDLFPIFLRSAMSG